MKTKILTMLGLGGVLMFSACANREAQTSTVSTDPVVHAWGGGHREQLFPAGPKPAWAPGIDREMQVVIEKMMSYNAPPIETLTPQAARKQPTPAMAVRAVIKEKGIPVAASQVDTSGTDIPVEGGSVHARVYTPRGGTAPYPVIVYYHGGGWVIGDLNAYDASARALAEQTDAMVVSVHYRQAPEYKFPTAHNDAFAAYQWVLNNAGSINGDPKRVAVAGESAGGNLACNVSIMARDKGIAMPMHQVLIYPVANTDMNTESYRTYAAAKPLNKPMMQWFMKHALPDMGMARDSRLALVRADLKGLPPTTVITAQIDPLHDEGLLLARRLSEADVRVRSENYEGVTHEFFGMTDVVPEARLAQRLAGGHLRRALGQ